MTYIESQTRDLLFIRNPPRNITNSSKFWRRYELVLLTTLSILAVASFITAIVFQTFSELLGTLFSLVFIVALNWHKISFQTIALDAISTTLTVQSWFLNRRIREIIVPLGIVRSIVVRDKVGSEQTQWTVYCVTETDGEETDISVANVSWRNDAEYLAEQMTTWLATFHQK